MLTANHKACVRNCDRTGLRSNETW